jgi:hypothetical protein
MRFEQWAQNPTCEANAISAVHNVRMWKVAHSVGLERTFGQSPFAIARGRDFENSLFANGAARLIEELIAASVLPAGADGFSDLRLRMNGGPRVPSLDVAIAETRQLIESLADGTPGNGSRVVAGATVRIPRGVMLPEAILIIDVLVVRGDLDPPQLVVGEIKTYPDRGGYTDATALAGARAQAGLYVHALQVVIDELGLSDRVRVIDHGFLVLTRPGSYWPSIRANEDLRYQALRAARGFELLERAAHRLPDVIADDDGDVDERLTNAILRGGHAYSQACLSFCDLAPRCHAEAAERGDAIVLGDDVRRFVGGIALERVLQLLRGSPPRDEAERDVVESVRAAEMAAAP